MCGWIASLTCDVEPGLKLLEHRGIRSVKVETFCGASVGHVRLPIVGLGPEWDQPVTFDSRYTLVFAGEILNFRDSVPNAECDLPVVMEAWATDYEYGFTDFDGFWSIGIVDNSLGLLHLICDYLAQKPTYYRKDLAAAANELDALAALGPVTPDEVYFAAVVKWGYCPETWRTPYVEISKMLPGEFVTLSKKAMQKTIVDPLKPKAANLRHEIEEAVRRRVVASDVPVACLVSGGLDSSIVYTLAKRHGPVRPYFADSDDLEERVRVSAVASPEPVKQIFWDLVSRERALYYMQEPIDLGSLIPQTALSDQVKERVCLTGDGADELFGGYGRAMRYDSQQSDIFHELVAWHLPRLDRIMMRNKVEVRSPFLARRVVQGAMVLPWREHRQNKKYLRDLFRDILPPGIADAEKKPLRTEAVEQDRELNTAQLVAAFRNHKWPGRLSDRVRKHLSVVK